MFSPIELNCVFVMFIVANGGVNQRKRRREINMNQLMSSLLHQQQFHNHNQIVDVNQLRSRNVDVSTGLRLAFNDQQQLQHQHSISSQSSLLSLLTQQINQQRDEIEHFLHAQVKKTKFKTLTRN